MPVNCLRSLALSNSTVQLKFRAEFMVDFNLDYRRK